MNNTLTGLGLALVLALVAALVGPWFVNWNAYRDDFARQASALVGAPVTVSGAVDARLLPSPYLRFRDLTAGQGASRLSIAEIEVTLAVGPLLRGAFKAERVKVIRPTVTLAAGPDGAVQGFGSGGAPPFDAARVSFDRAEIVDGALVATTPSGRLALDDIDGIAEAGSLAGPFRFEGSARAAGERGGLRASTGRTEADGALRVKLAVEGEERPERLDLDGRLFLGPTPRFDGAVTLVRPAERRGQPDGSGSAPWRVAAKIDGGFSGFKLDGIDLQYGSEDRGARIGGRGRIDLSVKPRFDLSLETRQIDLDRLAGESSPKGPAAALGAFAERFPAALRPPLEGRAELDVRGVVLAGDVVRDLKASLVAEPAGWRVEKLAAALPAGGRLEASGAIAFADTEPGFAGRVAFESADLNGFRRWLTGAEVEGAPVRSVAIVGDVSARSDAIAVRRAKLTVDGAASTGDLSWRAASGDERGRVEAALEAERLDLDALGLDRVIAGALKGADAVDVVLALDARTLVLAGVRMSGVVIDGALDAGGFHVKRISVADAEGAKLSGSGRIANGAKGPEGRLAFTVDSRSVGPLVKLARDAGASDAALDLARDRSTALAPLKLAVDVEASGGVRTITAKGSVAGGAFEGRYSGAALSADAEMALDLKLASPDGRRLALLAGLEVSPVVTAKGGELAVRLRGAPARGMTGEARFAALGVEVTGRGEVALAPVVGLSASGDVALRADDLSALGAALGRLAPGAAPATPASLTAKALVTAGEATFETVKGEVAGRQLSGRLVAPFDRARGIEGAVAIDELPFAAIAALGLSPEALAPGRATRRGVWPATAFGPSPTAGLQGRIDVAAARLPLAEGEVVGDARFRIGFKQSGLDIEDFTGAFAGGKLTGTLKISRSNADATVSAAGTLSGARLEQLVPGDTSPLSGVVDLRAEAQGVGRTTAAMFATLTGAGSAQLRSVRLRALDMAAIDAIEPQVEAGLALDAQKVVEALEKRIGAADLSLDRASVAFTVSGGAVRTGAIVADSPTGRLGGAATLDLARLALDADLTLAPNWPDAPQIGVSFEGPLSAPKRRFDATALTSWLSVRAVERETARIEKMEVEIREKARLARLLAEEERKREEAGKAEEAKRAEEARVKAEAERRRREAEAGALIEALPSPHGAGRSGGGLPSSLDISPPASQQRNDGEGATPPGGAFGNASASPARPGERQRPTRQTPAVDLDLPPPMIISPSPR